MGKLERILGITIFSLAFLAVAALVAFQAPSVQTKAAQKAIEMLREHFDADISIGQIHLMPVSTVFIQDLDIVDPSPCCADARDTLLHVGSMTVRFSIRSLIGPGHDDIILKAVRLKDAQFNLVIEQSRYSNNLSRLFRLVPQDTIAPMSEEDIIRIKDIDAENLSFRMQNFTMPPSNFPQSAIDWADLDVTRINIHARNFRISDGLFSATVDDLSFKEKSGWEVRKASGSTVTGKGLVRIDGFRLDDGVSTLDLDFKMIGKSQCYPDFVNKVKMVADIRRSRLSMKTLGHFIPPMCYATDDVFAIIEGHAEGPVCDIAASDLHLSFQDTGFATTVSGGVKNLPDVDNMFINAHLFNTSFRFSDIKPILGGITTRLNVDLGRIAKGKTFNADIFARGNINNLSVITEIKDIPSQGTFSLSGSVQNVLKMGTPPIKVKGSLSTNSLDIGAFTGTDILGRATLSTDFEATLPVADAAISLRADSLDIRQAQVWDYTYKAIGGNISLEGGDLSADLRSADPNLDADLAVWSDKYSFNGALTVRRADLNAMKIDTRDTAKVQFSLYGRLDKDLDNLQGNVNLSNIALTNSEGTFNVDNITLNAAKQPNGYDITLSSSIAEGTFLGNGRQFRSAVTFGNTADLLAYMLPGVYLQGGSHIMLQMDSTGMVSGRMESGRLAYKNNFIRDINVDVTGPADSLQCLMRSSEIQAAGYILQQSAVDATFRNKVLDFQYSFDNAALQDDQQLLRGNFNASIDLSTPGGLDFAIKPSRVTSSDGVWEIPSSSGSIRGREIVADNVMLHSGEQTILISGKTSAEREDRLRAQIKNFDLSVTDRFLKGMQLNLRGMLNADIVIGSPVGEGIPGIEMKVDCNDILVSGTPLGNLNIRSEYDGEEDLFKIRAKETIGKSDVLKIDSSFDPEDEIIEAIVRFKDFPIGFARGFIPDVFYALEGKLMGQVCLSGPLKDLEVSGTGTCLRDGLVGIAFTHVPYRVEGDFSIDNGGIHAGNMLALDRFGNGGPVSGGLKWENFRNPLMDLHFDVDNVEAINIPSSDPGVFYGQIFASGDADITGPFNSLQLSADAVTQGNSRLHVVISGDMDATRSDLLTFVEPGEKEIDPYEEILKKFSSKKNTEKSDFKIRIHAMADPRLKTFLDLGSGGFAAGVSGSGNGEVNLAVDSGSGNFSIMGDYTLTEGSFGVNASNLVHKEFIIKRGSSIKFPGDIMQSTVNLDAVYQTKASIASLIADTTSISNRRLVECGINIQNRLTNPQVRFSINIPDLEPSVKSSVESALSTEDKVQKQFLSLLLSNNFLPDEQSGIVDNSSLLYSNVSEMMANQVNNIFSRLNIPLDLGLNYQPTERGTNVFDVALSTQLFNNRVIVGGSLGNRPGVTSDNGSLVGDLDVEIKLDRRGAFRLNLFSHSADAYTKYLDNSQRNGVGITWQQEFDNFPTWVKMLFCPSVRRQAAAAVQAAENKKTKTLILDE